MIRIENVKNIPTTGEKDCLYISKEYGFMWCKNEEEMEKAHEEIEESGLFDITKIFF